jgi:hypothetical protein
MSTAVDLGWVRVKGGKGLTFRAKRSSKRCWQPMGFYEMDKHRCSPSDNQTMSGQGLDIAAREGWDDEN